MKKALIAMSGGVDSSVAAVFMKEKGYDPIGRNNEAYMTMRILICQRKRHVVHLSDIEDARSVALQSWIFHIMFLILRHNLGKR